MAFLASALVAGKAIADAYKTTRNDQPTGAQSAFNNPKWTGAPTAPDFDAYRLNRRGTGAHDVTLNRPLVVKRFATPIVKPLRPIQQRVHFRRQVGPKAAAWLQHTLAEAMIPDPPFFNDSKAVAYNRRLVQQRMPRMHLGLTVVDRELKGWNDRPFPMYYGAEGHPHR